MRLSSPVPFPLLKKGRRVFKILPSTSDTREAFFFFGHLGPSCSRQDLHCILGNLSLQFADLVAEAQEVSFPSAWGILVPQPGMEPVPLALQGEILITGPPGNSLSTLFLNPRGSWGYGAWMANQVF